MSGKTLRLPAPAATVAALLILIPAAVALGRAVPVGGEIPVNTTGGDHDFAAVAMDSSGAFAFAFESPDGGPIAARRFSATGVPLTGEIQMSAMGAIGQEDPAIASDPAGNLVVAWEDGDSAEPDEVKARLLSAGGTLSPIIEVNQTTAGDQDEPQVGVDDAGNFVIAWEGNGPGDDSGIFFRRFNAAGSPLSNEVPVNQTTSGPQYSAAIGVNGGGQFIVAWNVDDAMNEDVYARRFSPSGTAVSNEFLVNEDTADYAEEPGAGIDAAGNSVVGWIGVTPADSDGGAFFRVFNPQGAPSTGEKLANSTTANYQGATDRMGTTMDPNGNIVLAWEDDSAASSPDVTARRFDVTGAPLTPELHVNTTTDGTQLDARVASNAHGDFVVGWEGEDASMEVDIFARIYDVPDVTPPGLEASAASPQKAGKPVKLGATCDEACLATASGKVTVKGGGKRGKRLRKKKTFKLKPAQMQLVADVPGTLKLKPKKKKDAKRLKSLVKKGARAKASVTAGASDEAGNAAQPVALKVKLKR